MVVTRVIFTIIYILHYIEYSNFVNIEKSRKLSQDGKKMELSPHAPPRNLSYKTLSHVPSVSTFTTSQSILPLKFFGNHPFSISTAIHLVKFFIFFSFF